MKTPLIFLLIFLTACASPQPITIEVTRISLQTVIVTQIVERIITATPLPTSTPMPTNTPTVTPVPFARWTPDQVITAFLADSLEVGDFHPMAKEDYGAAPMMATSGIHFFIPSLCPDCGGRIFAFDTPSGLAATKVYYDELGKGSAFFFSWVFVKDNILLQINGELPESKAALYQAALETLH